MSYILGIDEVGRGAWAGPLVVGVVNLGDSLIEGLTDSKLLALKDRERIANLIYESCISASLGWVTSGEIDKLGLTKATSLAISRALEDVDHSGLEIIIDGNINYLPELQNASCQIKADLYVPAVSAAGIIAKVARDEYMRKLAESLPGFGFESHVGYGTKIHRENIDKWGVCSEHRLSFKPLSVYA